jgi:hypothetical protein
VRKPEGDNGLYLIGTLVIVLALTVAWMAGRPSHEWVAMQMGTEPSPPVQVLPRPHVVYGR